MHTINRNSVLFFSITLLLIGLNELGYGVVAFPLLVLPACWLIYRALLQEMPTEYKYDRELPTGLGDRLGVYTCLSAMALTLGIKVHTYWTEDASTSSPSWRYISSDFIQRYIRFPENLIFHSKAELQELQIPRLSWTGGTLPAAFAYDCLPTLAYHTFNLRNFIDKKDAGEFLKAYRKTSAALQIQVPPMPAGGREKYGVLHIRAGDKSNWHPLFMGTTQNMMDVIKQHLEGIHTCYIITDDVNCLERFHFDEGFFKRAPDMEDHNLAMLRDFKLLLEAQWIVQHAENGWSAFSNIPACLRGIPIINTYPKIGQNLLDRFRKLKGLPGEFHYFDQADKFMEKVNGQSLKSGNISTHGFAAPFPELG